MLLFLTISLDWIVSERVLQHRLTQLKQQAATTKGAELNLSLNAQILAVETRINAIIGLIQQGAFSFFLVGWSMHLLIVEVNSLSKNTRTIWTRASRMRRSMLRTGPSETTRNTAPVVCCEWSWCKKNWKANGLIVLASEQCIFDNDSSWTVTKELSSVLLDLVYWRSILVVYMLEYDLWIMCRYCE